MDIGEEILGKDVLCIITTHIDDIKGSGDKPTQDELLKACQRDYGGDVKIEIGEFEHTGIRHVQNKKDFSIYTHQNHYITEITEIPLANVNTTNPQEPLTDELKTLFWSLLGALSWLQQTRADIAPFIGYLQRVAHEPVIDHVKKANHILRYVRRVKCGLHYRKLVPPLKMVTAADIAYKANEDLTECTALRGYIILVVGSSSSGTDCHFPGGPCTVLDWVSKKFSVITRSSFCAELRNQLEAAQTSLYLSQSLEENCRKIESANVLSQLLDQGKLQTPIHLCGDNKGVSMAVSAQNPKTPAEPNLTSHVRAIREFVDRTGHITTLVWVDNRDMIADPLTKGKTIRNALIDVLDKGIWKIVHPTEFWPRRQKRIQGSTQ